MSSRNHTEVEVPKLEEIAIAVALVAAGSPLRLMTRGWDEAGLMPGLPPTTSVVEVRMPVGLLSRVWMRVGISSFVELVWAGPFWSCLQRNAIGRGLRAETLPTIRALAAAEGVWGHRSMEAQS